VGAIRQAVSYQDLLDCDSRPENVPVALRRRSDEPIGPTDVPRERYVDRAFHELEKERMWKRTWQMACRVVDVADVGDTLVYDICDISLLIVRVATDTVKAYFNACLHRGRQLKDADGNNEELRCAFHGFCWNLDGSLRQIPCEWDFPHVDRAEWRLPEAHVGTWGGFVFVNMDERCGSLAEFLGDLPEQFDKWPLDRRYKSVHVAKVIEANWKVVQEAFMEALHVVSTHPQLLPGIGDTNSQYDWSGNWSRAITANATPSPAMSTSPTQQDVFDAVTGRRRDQDPLVVLGESDTARAVIANGGRHRLRRAIGDGADRLSDAEVVDSFYYTLFPNLHPWGAYNRIVYRFRPHGDRHDTAVMEVMFLETFDPSRPKPAAVPIHWLGIDDPWSEAPELGLLAAIFEQDSSNLPQVQKGLASLRKPVTLSAYQETKIRHFHHVLAQTLSEDASGQP
jgi:phenylpropionate dioxygenase-like ring-hydroxylating dioxygenase large terminal subunit